MSGSVRFELETSAALFECDPESAWMQPLDGEKYVSFGVMFREVEWTNDISAHVDAPLPLSGSSDDKQWAARANAWKAEARAEQPKPVAYRVKIVIEYEALSEEESAKAIAEARERDARRVAQEDGQ